MRIYVPQYRVVKRDATQLRFAPGWYDVEEAIAGAMVREELAFLEEPKVPPATTPGEGVMHAATPKVKPAAAPDPGPGVMHPATRKGGPLPAEPEPAGVMHPPTSKVKPAEPVATSAAVEAAAAPAVHAGDDDATGVKELVVDAAPEFAQPEPDGEDGA